MRINAYFFNVPLESQNNSTMQKTLPKPCGLDSVFRGGKGGICSVKLSFTITPVWQTIINCFVAYKCIFVRWHILYFFDKVTHIAVQ